MIHEPSAVPIYWVDSLPVPAVGAVNWPNSELVSMLKKRRLTGDACGMLQEP